MNNCPVLKNVSELFYDCTSLTTIGDNFMKESQSINNLKDMFKRIDENKQKITIGTDFLNTKSLPIEMFNNFDVETKTNFYLNFTKEYPKKDYYYYNEKEYTATYKKGNFLDFTIKYINYKSLPSFYFSGFFK